MNELGKLFASLNIKVNHTDLNQIMGIMDRDRSGAIDFDVTCLDYLIVSLTNIVIIIYEQGIFICNGRAFFQKDKFDRT